LPSYNGRNGRKEPKNEERELSNKKPGYKERRKLDRGRGSSRKEGGSREKTEREGTTKRMRETSDLEAANS